MSKLSARVTVSSEARVLFSAGVTLRKTVRDATVDALDGLAQLLEVILSSPGERLCYIHISFSCVSVRAVKTNRMLHLI